MFRKLRCYMEIFFRVCACSMYVSTSVFTCFSFIPKFLSFFSFRNISLHTEQKSYVIANELCEVARDQIFALENRE